MNRTTVNAALGSDHARTDTTTLRLLYECDSFGLVADLPPDHGHLHSLITHSPDEVVRRR